MSQIFILRRHMRLSSLTARSTIMKKTSMLTACGTNLCMRTVLMYGDIQIGTSIHDFVKYVKIYRSELPASPKESLPLGGKVVRQHRMRGSHSSEWRLYSTERGCTDGRLRVLPLISQLRQDVFRFRSRNRRCSADEEKLRETLYVSYSSPPRGSLRGTNRSKPSPLGEGGASAPDEG
mgnify:CR=1 FL=1